MASKEVVQLILAFEEGERHASIAYSANSSRSTMPSRA